MEKVLYTKNFIDKNGDDNMKTTERFKLIQQLKRHEGVMLKVYRCPANKLTIGIGRNLQDKGLTNVEQNFIFGEGNMSKNVVIDEFMKRKVDDKGNNITVQEAEWLLERDIENCVSELERHKWFTELDSVRQDAIINMCFNMGYGGLMKFTRMIKALELKDYITASKEASNSRWYKQVGNRSKEIVQQILTGVYQ